MMYQIVLAKNVEKVLKKWKKSNPQLFKKTAIILGELITDPRNGTGHPEALVGGNGITYSRHISAHDRIIYDIHDNIVEVHVIKIEGHYNDK